MKRPWGLWLCSWIEKQVHQYRIETSRSVVLISTTKIYPRVILVWGKSIYYTRNYSKRSSWKSEVYDIYGQTSSLCLCTNGLLASYLCHLCRGREFVATLRLSLIKAWASKLLSSRLRELRLEESEERRLHADNIPHTSSIAAPDSIQT